MEFPIVSILASLAAVILLNAGCRSPVVASCREYRTPAPIRSYLDKEDYNQMAEYMGRLDLLAKSKLRIGMSKGEVRKSMGRPLSEGPLNERVEMWSYAPSISATFEYWVVFMDETLDFFGAAQTTWLWERYSLSDHE